MGMYTELMIGFSLLESTPKQVIDTLQQIVSCKSRSSIDTSNLPNHSLFKEERWWLILKCSSYYFGAQPVSSFKHYGNEIEHFCNWIAPYVESHGSRKSDGKQFIGYYRYEED